MDDIATLLLFSTAMLVGCYFSGSIPLAITMSEEKLKLVSTMGAGLLVGTALAVIIPEGVHSLYSASHPHTHRRLSRSLLTVAEIERPSQNEMKINAINHQSEHIHAGTEMHTFIGIALVLGFVFMLIIDQLGGKHTHVQSIDATETSHHNRNKITATLGLVVHAAADGIALGAAATTSETHVEIIVFAAIMLHKARKYYSYIYTNFLNQIILTLQAPAAFGLTSFLLHEGFDRSRIKKHLAIFSAAAPIAAVLTFFGLAQGSKEALSDINATGIAMLFSAGTFLYVSTVHVLPELVSSSPTRSVKADGTIIIQESKTFTRTQLILMVIGALLPVILSLNHHH
ncbi:DgyrCDS8534 [Dimorphilus gyrociliatus]|uniref:DgyrCDS8534 n=1 Tax=Dimorphilus gyrociliatus TaxID=2664684 RepID=A0A7I8VWR5_9ANNE|nr:DgyrCDS8534 [Dimorphilus gyrociliatus]